MTIDTWVIIIITVVLFFVGQYSSAKRADRAQVDSANMKDTIADKLDAVAAEVEAGNDVVVRGQKSQEDEKRFKGPTV